MASISATRVSSFTTPQGPILLLRPNCSAEELAELQTLRVTTIWARGEGLLAFRSYSWSLGEQGTLLVVQLKALPDKLDNEFRVTFLGS